MVFHFRKFFIGQLIRFFQNIIVDCHFADIMKCASQIHFLNLCGIVAGVRCKCGGFLCNTNGVSACKRRFIVDDLRKKVGDIFAGFPVKGLFFSRNDLPEFRFKGVIPESCKFVI